MGGASDHCSRGRKISEGEVPVDMTSLAANTLGNRGLQQEVLKLFLSQSDLLLARAEEAEDLKGCQEAVHTLKGSARGVGAHLVALACEAAEGQMKTGEAPALADLRETVAKTNRFIRSLVED